jgi:hypothetical protein
MGHTPNYVYNWLQTFVWAIIGYMDSGILGMFSYGEFIVGLFVTMMFVWSFGVR